MFKKPLVIATIAATMGMAGISTQASAGDPLVGAIIGGGIGAAIGHNHGRDGGLVGGVLGAIVGSSIAADSGRYYDRGYYNRGSYDRGYYGSGSYDRGYYGSGYAPSYASDSSYYNSPSYYSAPEYYSVPQYYQAAPAVVYRSRPTYVSNYDRGYYRTRDYDRCY